MTFYITKGVKILNRFSVFKEDNIDNPTLLRKMGYNKHKGHFITIQKIQFTCIS
jgi:hypothetical protein